jgi:CubicO group peptidase (beta-lactamase class C family)
LALEAVGQADIQAHKPMTTDALFWIASQSKSITAAAFMMLVDEGKVNLDDRVEKYVPEFEEQWLFAEHDKAHQLLKKPGHPITVRHVLSHTSGMPKTSAMEKPALDMLPLWAAVRSYTMTPLQFEPGSGFRYSNAGINTAGRIIEVVTGMPYEEFMNKRLFEPLGMHDTTFRPNQEQLARLAKSYQPGAAKSGLEATPIGSLTYPLDDIKRQPVPAGGLFSTASDIARFCQMLLNGGQLDGKRYLSEQALREMTRRQTPASVKQSYGLGWRPEEDGSFGHGGAYATSMTIDPANKLIMVYMVQHASFAGDAKRKCLTAFQQAANERFAPRVRAAPRSK